MTSWGGGEFAALRRVADGAVGTQDAAGDGRAADDAGIAAKGGGNEVNGLDFEIRLEPNARRMAALFHACDRRGLLRTERGAGQGGVRAKPETAGGGREARGTRRVVPRDAEAGGTDAAGGARLPHVRLRIYLPVR